MPDHVLVPVMAAAMMPPIAIPMECPVLPHTCAANSVVISRPRLGEVRGVVACIVMEAVSVAARIGSGKRPIDRNRRNHWLDDATSDGCRLTCARLPATGEIDRW